MKKSVQILQVRGKYVRTRTMGAIAQDIIKVLVDTFGEEKAYQLCDDLGSILIPTPDKTAKEWIKEMLED